MRLVAVGASLGGVDALVAMFLAMGPIAEPVLMVQHRAEGSANQLAKLITGRINQTVIEPDAGDHLMPGAIYLAPSGYHMLLDDQYCIQLSVEDKHLFARPSIDVLFNSVAHCCGTDSIGILLTCSSEDGATGLCAIQDQGGQTFVQAPSSATSSVAVRAALDRCTPDFIGTPKQIGIKLRKWSSDNQVA